MFCLNCNADFVDEVCFIADKTDLSTIICTMCKKKSYRIKEFLTKKDKDEFLEGKENDEKT